MVGPVIRMGALMNLATSMQHPPPAPATGQLGRVFWGLGVVPSNLLWALALWALGTQRIALMLGVFAVLLLYTGWIIPTVWRAAPSAANPDLGLAARGLTVAWGLNTALLVFFLTLQQVAQ